MQDPVSDSHYMLPVAWIPSVMRKCGPCVVLVVLVWSLFVLNNDGRARRGRTQHAPLTLSVHTPHALKDQLHISGQEQACFMQATSQMGTMKSMNKLRAILHMARLSTEVSGDFVEAGVAEGGGSFAILYYLACTGLLRERTFHLFDTWEGLPESAHRLDAGFSRGQYHKGLEVFYKNAEQWKSYYQNQTAAFVGAIPWDEAVGHLNINVGLFTETMPGALKGQKVIALFCDGDMYQSSIDCLEGAAPSLLPRAYIYQDDYFSFSGNYEAVKLWRKNHRDVGDIHLVQEKDPFVLHPELSSPCEPPKGNGPKDYGKCNTQRVEAGFWQHWAL